MVQIEAWPSISILGLHTTKAGPNILFLFVPWQRGIIFTWHIINSKVHTVNSAGVPPQIRRKTSLTWHSFHAIRPVTLDRQGARLHEDSQRLVCSHGNKQTRTPSQFYQVLTFCFIVHQWQLLIYRLSPALEFPGPYFAFGSNGMLPGGATK